ncbi:hypothetical protein B0H67DRAFT_610943 [Lasiosphaeris hirsuta]|uniref:Uncharacterized protein n=1 Tax=Lasiosphaeris hirsuta TaxID=260670 RepID=A0AA40A7M6_9PEZI|nr:hypothetical protein B0H67DRAFT_610943 [Lasiosphaeris hirsuta]
MSLLLAPYNDSMRLGMGFNSYTQTICIDQAVAVDKQTGSVVRSEGPSQSVTYSSRFVSKLSEILSTMNISYGSSIKKGTVEVSGSTSTVDEEKIKESDLNAVISVKVVNQTTIITENSKFQPIEGLAPGSTRMGEVYGDCYISGFIEGGDFTGIVSIRALDRSQAAKIADLVKSGVSRGGSGSDEDFTLDGFQHNIQGSANSALTNTETTIAVSWMGGGQIKDAKSKWDMDELFAAAAAFPSNVAKCPQRTWAILTKYKANRSFVEWSSKMQISPLEYDSINSFTGELFDNFMEYKQILKLVQTILRNRDNFEVQSGKHNAIPVDVPSLAAVRSALRAEMSKIVTAVDILSHNPGALKKVLAKQSLPINSLVRSIILESQYGRGLSEVPGTSKAPIPTPSSEVEAASPGLKATDNTSRIAPGPTPAATTSAPATTSTAAPTSAPAAAAAALTTPAPPATTAAVTTVPKPVKETLQPSPRPAVADDGDEDFDFNSLVPPEIWSDLLPVPKKGVEALLTPTKAEDSQAAAKVISFPPPPVSDPPPTTEGGNNVIVPIPANEPRTSAPPLPNLEILGAAYGDGAVTEAVRALVDTKTQTLTIDTTWIPGLGLPDTWVGVQKVISVLYRYSDSSSLFMLVAVEKTGTYKISHGGTSAPGIQRVALNPWRPDVGFHVVAVVWGDVVVNNPKTVDNITVSWQNHWTQWMRSEWIGQDTWPGAAKTFALFYQMGTEDAPVKVMTCREWIKINFRQVSSLP